MSRIIAGKLRLDVQRVVLADVVEQALRSIQPAVKERGLRLEKTIDPSAGASRRGSGPSATDYLESVGQRGQVHPRRRNRAGELAARVIRCRARRLRHL